MTKTFSLTQLVETANQRLAAEGLDPAWNERLVRYYTSEKKVLTPPDKDGRNAVYTEDHVEKLVTLKRAQKLGFTAEAFDNATKYTDLAGSQMVQGAQAFTSNTFGMASASSLVGSLQQSFARSTAQSLFSANAVSGTATADSSSKNEALAFLQSLDPQQKDERLLGQAVSMLSQPLNPQVKKEPERWVTWEVFSGVKIELREDMYSVFNADHERQLVEAVRNIRKTKPQL